MKKKFFLALGIVLFSGSVALATDQTTASNEPVVTKAEFKKAMEDVKAEILKDCVAKSSAKAEAHVGAVLPKKKAKKAQSVKKTVSLCEQAAVADVKLHEEEAKFAAALAAAAKAQDELAKLRASQVVSPPVAPIAAVQAPVLPPPVMLAPTYGPQVAQYYPCGDQLLCEKQHVIYFTDEQFMKTMLREGKFERLQVVENQLVMAFGERSIRLPGDNQWFATNYNQQHIDYARIRKGNGFYYYIVPPVMWPFEPFRFNVAMLGEIGKKPIGFVPIDQLNLGGRYVPPNLVETWHGKVSDGENGIKMLANEIQ